MSRLLGPDPSTRTITLISGSDTFDFSGRAATAYLDSGLTQLADIAAYDSTTPTVPGSSVAGSRLTVGANSQLPRFWFPDGVDTLYFAVTGLQGYWTATADADSRLDYLGYRMAGRAILKPYFAKLAGRASTRCNIVVIGDSRVAGQGASTFANRWVSRAAAQMRSRLGLAVGGAGFIGVTGSGLNSFTWPAVLAGSPTLNPSYGPNTNAATFLNTGHSATYATVTGTAVDILMNDANGATITSKIGAAAAVDQVVPGTNVDGRKIRVTLGSSGNYTFVIGWKSGLGVYIDGIIVYDGDENQGLHIHDAGHYGWAANDWATTNQSATRWPAAIEALNPAVIVIALGQNDVLTRTPAQLSASIATIVASIRARMTTSTPPFVLMFDAARQTYKSQWPAYVQAGKDLAATDSQMTVLDLADRIPNYDDTSNLSAYYDGVHLNDLGQQLVADAFVSYFLP